MWATRCLAFALLLVVGAPFLLASANEIAVMELCTFETSVWRMLALIEIVNNGLGEVAVVNRDWIEKMDDWEEAPEDKNISLEDNLFLFANQEVHGRTVADLEATFFVVKGKDVSKVFNKVVKVYQHRDRESPNRMTYSVMVSYIATPKIADDSSNPTEELPKWVLSIPSYGASVASLVPDVNREENPVLLRIPLSHFQTLLNIKDQDITRIPQHNSFSLAATGVVQRMPMVWVRLSYANAKWDLPPNSLYSESVVDRELLKSIDESEELINEIMKIRRNTFRRQSLVAFETVFKLLGSYQRHQLRNKTPSKKRGPQRRGNRSRKHAKATKAAKAKKRRRRFAE